VFFIPFLVSISSKLDDFNCLKWSGAMDFFSRAIHLIPCCIQRRGGSPIYTTIHLLRWYENEPSIDVKTPFLGLQWWNKNLLLLKIEDFCGDGSGFQSARNNSFALTFFNRPDLGVNIDYCLGWHAWMLGKNMLNKLFKCKVMVFLKNAKKAESNYSSHFAI